LALHIYNTMNRKKELFEPLEEGKVGMYVCGVTVYDLSHIGHARVYVAFDAVYRFLKYLGYEVKYVRNFTDVDDKIIARANERGEDPLALSERFIGEYYQDMDSLGVLRPDVEPKVSTHIEEIIALTQSILDNGHAYVIDGDVYFSIDSYPAYGKLSGRKLEDNRAGERVAVDERKKNPFDFALWKSAKPGEPTWESPWGLGRPGWHIECSAMSNTHLGGTFDIHAGGKDLIFPHHENEVAQSEAANKCEFSRYWMHNGFVNVDAEKMSKSLGNFFTIREVHKLYHPQAVRWFLLSTQYRAPINYTERTLEEASDRVYYLYQTVADLQATLAAAKDTEDGPIIEPDCVLEIEKRMRQAMEDDFNTALTVGVISEPLKLINDLHHTKAGRKRFGRLATLAAIEGGLMATLGILGVGTDDPQQILGEMRDRSLARHGMTQADVHGAIDDRRKARDDKDWARADVLRDELLAKGVQLMDSPTGTTWRPLYELTNQEEEA
jgi:cysteinyl-tRNA synthetase